MSASESPSNSTEPDDDPSLSTPNPRSMAVSAATATLLYMEDIINAFESSVRTQGSLFTADKFAELTWPSWVSSLPAPLLTIYAADQAGLLYSISLPPSALAAALGSIYFALRRQSAGSRSDTDDLRKSSLVPIISGGGAYLLWNGLIAMKIASAGTAPVVVPSAMVLTGVKGLCDAFIANLKMRTQQDVEMQPFDPSSVQSNPPS